MTNRMTNLAPLKRGQLNTSDWSATAKPWFKGWIWAQGGQTRHCEERSDEAIQFFLAALDCFDPLAMTAKRDEEIDPRC
jgi:hypothetical protein